MEEKVTKPAIKGFILSLVLVVFAMILQFLGLGENSVLKAFEMILIFGGIIGSCIYYSKQMNANVTYGDVFFDGFKTSAAFTAITVVCIVIAMKFIFPEVVQQGLDKAKADMIAKNMSDEQIETSLAISKKFFVPLVVAVLLFFFLVLGAIASLIGAAAAKKIPTAPLLNKVNRTPAWMYQS